MTKKLQHIFALSEKGAKDLVKAVIWCFVCNVALMLPVGTVLFTVQHLLGCMENGGRPFLFCCSSSTGSSTLRCIWRPIRKAPIGG